jgi:hypothetical protein
VNAKDVGAGVVEVCGDAGELLGPRGFGVAHADRE